MKTSFFLVVSFFANLDWSIRCKFKEIKWWKILFLKSKNPDIFPVRFLYLCFREFAYFWIFCRFEQFYLNFYFPKIMRYRKLFIQEVIQILLYDLPELIFTLKMNAHDLFAINFRFFKFKLRNKILFSASFYFNYFTMW